MNYQTAFDVDIGEPDPDETFLKSFKPEVEVSSSKLCFSSRDQTNSITLRNYEWQRAQYKIVYTSINIGLSSDSGIIEPLSTCTVDFKVNDSLRNPASVLYDEYFIVKTQIFDESAWARQKEEHFLWVDEACQVNVISASIAITKYETAKPLTGFDIGTLPTAVNTGAEEPFSNLTGEHVDFHSQRVLDSGERKVDESTRAANKTPQPISSAYVKQVLGMDNKNVEKFEAEIDHPETSKLGTIGNAFFVLIHAFLIMYIIYLVCMDFLYSPCYGIWTEQLNRDRVAQTDFWVFFIQ